MVSGANLSHLGTGEPPRLGDIDLLIFDFDGVMTDNRVWVSSEGVESVACNRGDGWGLDMLRGASLKMAIISTEVNPVVRARAEKLRLPVLQGVKDKGETVRRYATEQGVPLERVAFVGNDTNDMPALSIVGWPICPRDSHRDVLAMARWVVACNGGAGVVRVLADTLLMQAPVSAGADSGPYTTLSSRLVFAAEPFVSITREHLRLKDGREIDDYYLITQPDYAVTVALLPDGKLVMLREYSHGAGRTVLSLPGGMIEPGEAPLDAARRELREETGYGNGRWEDLGDFVCHGSQGCGKAHFFLARNVVPIGGMDIGDPEHVGQVQLSMEEAKCAIMQGEISILGHAAALAMVLALRYQGE